VPDQQITAATAPLWGLPYPEAPPISLVSPRLALFLASRDLPLSHARRRRGERTRRNIPAAAAPGGRRRLSPSTRFLRSILSSSPLLSLRLPHGEGGSGAASAAFGEFARGGPREGAARHPPPPGDGARGHPCRESCGLGVVTLGAHQGAVAATPVPREQRLPRQALHAVAPETGKGAHGAVPPASALAAASPGELRTSKGAPLATTRKRHGASRDDRGISF
jgi:hypothetical protein